ncbi:MAG: hypothetical protein EOP56_09430 [Sphingobacteriales bacterium]|nr:MAG: hypothetical protein EOP56_09430 [Sphingobacteriales bacterium]
MPDTPLTKEQIEAKAKELSEKHACKVHGFEFINPENGDQVIGYIKEPNRLLKLYALDKGALQLYSVGVQLIDSCLIKDESDPRIYSESQEHDTYYFGAIDFANGLIALSRDQLKKK